MSGWCEQLFFLSLLPQGTPFLTPSRPLDLLIILTLRNAKPRRGEANDIFGGFAQSSMTPRGVHKGQVLKRARPEQSGGTTKCVASQPFAQRKIDRESCSRPFLLTHHEDTYCASQQQEATRTEEHWPCDFAGLVWRILTKLDKLPGEKIPFLPRSRFTSSRLP